MHTLTHNIPLKLKWKKNKSIKILITWLHTAYQRKHKIFNVLQSTMYHWQFLNYLFLRNLMNPFLLLQLFQFGSFSPFVECVRNLLCFCLQGVRSTSGILTSVFRIIFNAILLKLQHNDILNGKLIQMIFFWNFSQFLCVEKRKKTFGLMFRNWHQLKDHKLYLWRLRLYTIQLSIFNLYNYK